MHTTYKSRAHLFPSWPITIHSNKNYLFKGATNQSTNMQLVSFNTLARRILATLVVFIDVASSLHLVMVAFTHSECFQCKNPTLDY
jgi:hypothetical protein